MQTSDLVESDLQLDAHLRRVVLPRAGKPLLALGASFEAAPWRPRGARISPLFAQGTAKRNKSSKPRDTTQRLTDSSLRRQTVFLAMVFREEELAALGRLMSNHYHIFTEHGRVLPQIRVD